MEVIPALDLRGGRCVRLYQGDFSQETVFSEDPLAMARRWAEMGAPRLHIVDLDGARAGRLVHREVVERIAREVKVPLQVGGGLRSLEAIAEALSLGAGRAVLGTAAVEDEGLVQEACRRFGERVAVSIDAREGKVAARGWERQTSVPALSLASRMAELGVKRIIFTDIARDGTLSGPNFQDVARLLALPGLSVIASGGISSLEHLSRLLALGVEGAILGRALYAGEIDLRQALAVPQPPSIARRVDVSRLDFLEQPERRELPPEQVLGLLPLEPGQKVADIGCGPGYFTIPLAQRLAQGQVLALDIQPPMLWRLRERVQEAGVKNIDIMLCGELDFPIESGSLDGVLLGFVLHSMTEKGVEFLRALAALLKPGGWLGILEWVKAEMAAGPALANRITQEEVRNLAERAGLKVVREVGVGERYYLVLVKEAENPAG